MIGKVIDLLSARPGKTPVYFYFEDEKKLVSPGGILVSPGEELLAKLKDLLGKDNVALKA